MTFVSKPRLRTRRVSSVHGLLESGPSLRIIEREIRAQQALLADIQQLLPGDLMAHCIGAQLAGQRLTLHVESPAWATRIRFAASGLPRLLRQKYRSVEDIRVKVLPARMAPRPRARIKQRSEIGATVVRESADDIADSQLRNALYRLSVALKPTR